MQRRNLPLRQSDSILLYGFGLALALSLGFNGFLLYEQSRLQSINEYELGYSVHPVDLLDWQQQLSDCKRDNQEKDSLIRQLKRATNSHPGQSVIVQHHPSK